MMQVWYSNRLETLADRLIANLVTAKTSPASRLFSMPPIIVPNRNVETYLRYEIARGAGIAAGLDIKVPGQFLESLLLQRPGPRSLKLVSNRTLRALFIDILSDLHPSKEPLPDVVRAYIDAGGADRHARDLRRFQLASRLAQLARRYEDYRSNWLSAWAQGQASIEGGPPAGTEEWQSVLWKRLVEHVRAQKPGGKNWILPFELFADLEAANFEPPGEVHLFGFSYSWHGLPELIRYLIKKSHVSIYTLAPFVEFQNNLDGLDQKNASRHRPTRADPRSSIRSSRTIHRRHADSPLSISGAGPGGSIWRCSATFRETRFHPEYVAGDRRTVLARLQHEILEQSSATGEPNDPDDSLAILACPGIRREAEIVANEIWRLIRADADRIKQQPIDCGFAILPFSWPTGPIRRSTRPISDRSLKSCTAFRST